MLYRGHKTCYRYIFNSEYNLAFQKPLKDQCDLCTSYRNSSDQEKEKMKEVFHRHIEDKDLARQNKQTDKQRVQSGGE